MFGVPHCRKGNSGRISLASLFLQSLCYILNEKTIMRRIERVKDVTMSFKLSYSEKCVFLFSFSLQAKGEDVKE